VPTDTPTNSSDDPAKTVVSLSLDRDIVDWFKAHGPGYQEQMNRNLRAAMVDAQRHAALQADRARQKQQERLHQEMDERRAPAARAFFKALHAALPSSL
jgi:BrnA antitoxin of type II toxin-antitoxin system